MDSGSDRDDRSRSEGRDVTLGTSRHASPRLLAGWRRGQAAWKLRAEHRHVLPRRTTTGTSREGGFSTAELLGNAALGIAALVAIWVVLEALGVSVVAWIGAQIGVSGG